jgi:hypothetical protein
VRRSFRIWWDDNVRCWRWECTHCFPPARGGRFGPHAYDRIIRTSMPGHFRHRAQHHRWMAHNRDDRGRIKYRRR